LYPIGIELEYVRQIANFTDRFIQKVTPLIKRYTTVYTRTDSAESDLDALMQQIDAELLVLYGTNALSSGALGEMLSAIAEKVLGKNSAFMQKQIEIIAGTPIAIETPWWPETKALWEAENYKLIKNLSTDYISKVNSIIINGIQTGATEAEMAASIEKVAESLKGWRSRFIARDQIGKLNALVTKAQAKNVGLEYYFWTTAGDEKVRGNPSGKYPKAIPSHFLMDGTMCTWDNTDVYSLDLGKTWIPRPAKAPKTNPGMEFLCRCVCSLSWGPFLDDIDQGVNR
jgi:uncharacterized protein with gpF-like domain